MHYRCSCICCLQYKIDIKWNLVQLGPARLRRESFKLLAQLGPYCAVFYANCMQRIRGGTDKQWQAQWQLAWQSGCRRSSYNDWMQFARDAIWENLCKSMHLSVQRPLIGGISLSGEDFAWFLMSCYCTSSFVVTLYCIKVMCPYNWPRWWPWSALCLGSTS